QPGRQAAGGDARRDHPRAAPDRRSHAVCHARPEGGDDDGRPRGDPARRPAAATGHARPGLRPAGQRVRGRIHRLALAEPAARPARRRRRRLAPQLLAPGVKAAGDGCATSVGGARLTAPSLLEQRPALRGYLGKPVTLGIRPEDFGTDGDGGEIDVTVARLESLGSELVAYLAPAGMAADTLLTARLERRAALTEGGATRVNVDIDRLYF